MGTSDAVLPWALKILMIALVTVAVFIYRKPFSHLFSAVGYGTIGSQERAEYSLREAGSTFRRSTLDAATVAVPGVAGYRAARWARRNPGQAAALAAGVASGAAAGAAAGSAASAGAGPLQSASSDAYASRLRPDPPPPADGDGEASTGSHRVVSGVGGGGSARARNLPAAAADSGGRVAPPLDLPPRSGAVNGAGSGAGIGAGAGGGRGRGGGGPGVPGGARLDRVSQAGIRLVSRRRALGRRRARGRTHPGGVRRIPRTFGFVRCLRPAGLGASDQRR
jgi:hypothetical protein